MNFIKTAIKWIFGTLLVSLTVGLARFLLLLGARLVKCVWLSVKYSVIVSAWLLYHGTRLLTWPFRKCFPPKSIDSMSGLDFERFTAKWLALEGYRSIRTTPSTADYGVDILAMREGTPIAVQCKRYSGKVGVAAIQEITAGLPVYDCKKGIVVTNSAFTQNAIDLAVSNGIELIDGEDLKRSRAARTLVRGKLSMFMSSLLMAVITLCALFLTIWVIRFNRRFFPLALMFFIICALCLINGFCEYLDRKQQDNEEWDDEEWEDYEDSDPGSGEYDDFTDLSAPF